MKKKEEDRTEEDIKNIADNVVDENKTIEKSKDKPED